MLRVVPPPIPVVGQIAPAVTRKLLAEYDRDDGEDAVMDVVHVPLLHAPSTAVGGVSTLLTS